MAECKCKPDEACDVWEMLIKKRFPYIILTMEGEVIIPRDKVDDFVRRYSEMSDTEDHLLHLRMYRNSGERKGVPDSDD